MYIVNEPYHYLHHDVMDPEKACCDVSERGIESVVMGVHGPVPAPTGGGV